MKTNKRIVRTALLILLFWAILFTITFANNPELWGVTSLGGEYNKGTIFMTNGSGGSQQVIKSFNPYPGTAPNCDQLCLASNGKLYGTTYAGGSNQLGTIFEFDPTTYTYSTIHNFIRSSGASPLGGLIQAANGKLYGLTTTGGLNDGGVLYEFDLITKTYSAKYNFGSLTANGVYPQGTLVEATNGKLYGTSYAGGNNYVGTLFEYDPTSNTFAKKIDFNGSINGSYPSVGMMKATNGKLYGLCITGGTNDMGTMYEYDPTTNTFIVKKHFDGTSSGGNPVSILKQSSNGKLYGTANVGGSNGFGTLFEYNTSTESFLKKIDFDSASIGSYPQGGALLETNGKLYGVAFSGGANNKGVLYEYDTLTYTAIKKLDFDSTTIGSNPWCGLTQLSNGKIYTIASMGGKVDAGKLLEYDLDQNIFTYIFDFFVVDGGEPNGSLIKAADGKLYGTTRIGGAYDFGTIFEIDPTTQTTTIKHSFDDTNGSYPLGSLLEASNGKLYGMTSSGGITGESGSNGVLFEYDPASGIYTKKIEFNYTNGSNPHGSLIQAANGKLYGMTTNGGTSNKGTIFEYDIDSNTLTKKKNLYSYGGNIPWGSLMQASNGKLYGLSTSGSSYIYGHLFEYDYITDVYTIKIGFSTQSLGRYPYGDLIEPTNGKLYGMTRIGGAYNYGVIFEYDFNTNILSKKVDFDGTNGKSPYSSLMMASNGNLYGMTKLGGVNDLGVMFEYNYTSDTYTKKVDFDSANGANPIASNLIELYPLVTDFAKSPIIDKNLTVYSSPTKGKAKIKISGMNVQKCQIFVASISGEVIYENNELSIDNQTKEINLENLTSGIYIVKIRSNSEQKVAKFIIK